MSKVEKKNPLDDMYHLEEDSEQLEIGDAEEDGQAPGNDYNFDMEEFDNDQSDEDGAPQMDPEEVRRRENEILFAIQGVGQIKNINGYDVYVKNNQCEASLRDIHRFLKNDSMINPITKLTLGHW